jgi:hypothetical protein
MAATRTGLQYLCSATGIGGAAAATTRTTEYDPILTAETQLNRVTLTSTKNNYT